MTPPNPPEQELLEPCPWGHQDVVVVKHIASEGWSLECAECGCEGPRAPTEAEAITAWNRRTPAPSLSDEGAREQFKARMDSLVSMAEESPFHDESSKRAARAMRDFAVSSFNELAASRSTDLAKVVEALTGADQYLVWGMDSAQTSLERKGAMVDALTFVRQALASINAEGSAKGRER